MLNAKIVLEELIKLGWTPEAAKGMVANLMQESYNSIETSAVGGKGAAHGIMQWEGIRKRKAEEFLGKPLTQATLQEQVRWLDHEITTGGNGATTAYPQVKKMTDPVAATKFIRAHHIRPKNAEGNEDALRLDKLNLLNKYLGSQQAALPTQAQPSVAGVQGALNNAALAYNNAAAQNAQVAQYVTEGVYNMPDIAAILGVSSQQAIDALQQQYNVSAGKVDAAYAQMLANEQARMGIRQGVLNRYNADPTVAGSAADRSMQLQTQLQNQMAATIQAEQYTNNLGLFDNPAGFFEKVLFGNLYTKGREDLDRQIASNAQAESTARAMRTGNAEAAIAAKVPSADILRDRLAADLRLAELQANIGMKQADIPLSVARAQIDQMQTQANLLGNAAQLTNAQASALASSAQAQKSALTMPLEIDNATMDNLSRKMQLEDYQMFRAQNNELKQLEYQVKSAEGRTALEKAKQDYTLFIEQVNNGTYAGTQRAAAAAKLAELNSQIKDIKFKETMRAEIEELDRLGASVKNADTRTALLEVQAKLRATTLANNSGVLDDKAQNTLMAELYALKAKALQDMTTIDYNVPKLSAEEAKLRLDQAKKELEVKDKSDKVLNQGLAALGLTPEARSKLPNEAAEVLYSLGNGVPVSSNPAVSAYKMVKTGLDTSPKYPNMPMTIAAINSVKVPDPNGTGLPVPIAALKESELIATNGKEIFNSLVQTAVKSESETMFNTTNSPYGLRTPQELVGSAYTDAQTQPLLEELNAAIGTDESGKPTDFKSMSVEDFMKATLPKGIAPIKAGAMLHALAKASANANNAQNGYEIFGLPTQDSLRVSHGSEVYDLNVEADAKRLAVKIANSWSFFFDKVGNAMVGVGTVVAPAANVDKLVK